MRKCHGKEKLYGARAQTSELQFRVLGHHAAALIRKAWSHKPLIEAGDSLLSLLVNNQNTCMGILTIIITAPISPANSLQG